VFSTHTHKPLLIMLFWTVVFIINLGPEWQKFSGWREAIEVGGLNTLLQWLLYLAAHHMLVPQWLERDKNMAFLMWLFVLALLAAQCFILVSYLYLEPTYADTYGAFYLNKLGHYSLVERLGYSDLIKYILLSKVPTLLFPAVILIAAGFYEQQKHLLSLKQQKQAAELNALKNQLNPHFIFNTLNNIYSMAINGSAHTAEAIAKLSGIFDYVLHQCHDRYVALSAEIEMIDNYMALEKLRYGDRVQVTFTQNTMNTSAKVAPLLYLSLIENAFKHGASQALSQAEIDISIDADEQQVRFHIRNTKPSPSQNHSSSHAIGSANLKKQLELLYPGQHQLHVHETEDDYQVKLTLPSHGGQHD
jgi:hypothetical protein